MRHVHFGSVNVREFGVQIYLDETSGVAKVRMGSEKTNEYNRRLESWESDHGARRFGDQLRTDLAAIGRELFKNSQTVSVVQQGPSEDDPEPREHSVAFDVDKTGAFVLGCKGWLMKKGTDVAKWKKRWFEITPFGLLQYYDQADRKTRKLKGACALSRESKVTTLPTSMFGRSDCFEFTNLDWRAAKIKTRSRYNLTMQVLGDTQHQAQRELEKWTNVMRTVRRHVFPSVPDEIEVLTSADEQLGIELHVHENYAIINRFFPHAPKQMRIVQEGMQLVAINRKDLRDQKGRDVFTHLVALKGQQKRLAFAYPDNDGMQ